MQNLPKSLHTVRILVLVAREYWRLRGIAVADADPVAGAMHAAAICGYLHASPTDPLILKAAAQLVQS